jgi:hypothetical protein
VGGRGRRTFEDVMIQPVNPDHPADARARETDPWPYAVALAVMGPLALAFVVAVLIAVAG